MPRRPLVLLLFAAAACHPAAAPTPTPTAVNVPPPAPTTAPSSGLSSAPDGWQLMDESADHVPGISVGKARRELLAGKTPKTVVVAVIDGGVDTAHSALRPILYTAPNTHFGWDFIGGPKGDVHWDTYEQTRIVVRCRKH